MATTKWLTGIAYVMELVFFYTVLSIPYLFKGTMPPLLSFLLISTLGVLPAHLLLTKKKSDTKVGHLLLLAPFVAGFAWLLDFPIFVSLVLSAVFIWRVVEFHRNGTGKNLDSIFIVTLISGVSISFLFSLMGNQVYKSLLYLIFFQFFLMLIGKWGSGIQQVSQRSVWKKWAPFGWMIGGFLLLLAGAYAFFPLIRKLWSLFVNGFFKVLGFLLFPVFKWTDGIELNKNDSWKQLEKMGQSNLDQEKLIPYEPLKGLQYSWIYLLGLLFIIIVFLMYKNRKKLNWLTGGIVQHVANMSIQEAIKKQSRLFPKNRRPKHPVRRSLYDFEQFASKRGWGRQKGETLEEWLMRLNIHQENGIFDIYRNVRYGNGETTKEEELQLRNHLNMLKKRMDLQAKDKETS